MQQYAAASAAAPLTQAQAAMQPRQLAPAEIARLPSFDDPVFGDFATGGLRRAAGAGCARSSPHAAVPRRARLPPACTCSPFPAPPLP
jgi:hypothetical protein